MKVKGSSIANFVGYVTQRFGDEGLQKVLNALSESERELVTSPNLIAIDWVPSETVANCYAAMADVLKGGDESIIVDMGMYHADRDLKGVYRAFLRAFISPALLMKLAPKMFNTFFDPAGARIRKADTGEYIFTITGFRERERPIELSVYGWCKRALELVGTKNLKIQISKSVLDGDGISQLTASWD